MTDEYDYETRRHYDKMIDEGGHHMDNKNYAQARDAYLRVANSAAPQDMKEMAREFAEQAQAAINRRRSF